GEPSAYSRYFKHPAHSSPACRPRRLENVYDTLRRSDKSTGERQNNTGPADPIRLYGAFSRGRNRSKLHGCELVHRRIVRRGFGLGSSDRAVATTQSPGRRGRSLCAAPVTWPGEQVSPAELSDAGLARAARTR